MSEALGYTVSVISHAGAVVYTGPNYSKTSGRLAHVSFHGWYYFAYICTMPYIITGRIKYVPMQLHREETPGGICLVFLGLCLMLCELLNLVSLPSKSLSLRVVLGIPTYLTKQTLTSLFTSGLYRNVAVLKHESLKLSSSTLP